MKKRLLTFTLALAATLPLLANPTLFSKYESVRQALLKNSLGDVQSSAAQLAAEATKAKSATIAKQAQTVAKSADIDAARNSFAALSDEMIKLRGTAAGAKPSVYYCPMAKKSWLQPKGEVGNPYEPAMPTCGQLKAE